MEPEVRAKYMRMLRGLNVSENVPVSYWYEGVAEGEHGGIMKGREEGVEQVMEQGKATGLEEGGRMEFE